VEVAVSRSTVPKELHERYGLKPRNPLILISTWTVALAVFGFLFIQINSGQQADVETRLISWEVKTANRVEINWTVYQSSNLPVYCVLKAQDSDQFDVGFAIFKATETQSIPQFTQVINTNAEAFAVITPTCELEPEALLGSHFRPGLLPPAQDSPLFAPWQWNS
jgi:hypothetical protein